MATTTTPGPLSVREPGFAPRYVMTLRDGTRLSPLLVDRDGMAWCPAEGRIISDVMGFHAIGCGATGLRHTGFPDPVTRRRLAAAHRRWQVLAEGE